MNKFYLGLVIVLLTQTLKAQNNFPSTGNVSIGTTNSEVALQVVRGGTNSGNDYATINITTTGHQNIYGPILYLNGTSTPGGKMWGIVSSAPLDAAATGAVGNFAIYDTNGGARLVINSAGNVGIGTLAPDAKLAVNGTIHSTEIKVDMNGWPDYVFNPVYDLPTLKEVNRYIGMNHHLSDIPSAGEIEKNGLNLGEMNKLLVKKVEELTLYLIQHEKELEDQKLINKSDEERIKKLEQKVEIVIKNEN